MASITSAQPDLSTLEMNTYTVFLEKDLPQDHIKTGAITILCNEKGHWALGKEDRIPFRPDGALLQEGEVVTFNGHNVTNSIENLRACYERYANFDEYRYLTVLFREDGSIDQLNTEELQHHNSNPGKPDFFLTRGNKFKRFNPVTIQFVEDLEPDQNALEMQKKVSGVFTPVPFEFQKLPEGITEDDPNFKLFWKKKTKEGETKWLLGSPFCELQFQKEKDGTFLSTNFKPPNEIKHMLEEYVGKVLNAKMSENSRFKKFGLSRWGNEAVLQHFNFFLGMIEKKIQERKCRKGE